MQEKSLNGNFYGTIFIGLIGTGPSASLFCNEAGKIPEIVLASVYDDRRYNADNFARTNNIVHSTSDFAEFLNEVDCVYISTVNVDHFSLVKECLLARKHVLCKCPLCLAKAEAIELYELARNLKLALVEEVPHMYSPGFEELTKLINKGSIGKIHSIDVTFANSIYSNDKNIWNENGGSFVGYGGYGLTPVVRFLGTHSLDSFMWSLDALSGVDSAAKAVISYRDSIATVSSSVGVFSKNELIISGTIGHIVVKAPWWEMREIELVPGQRRAFEMDNSSEKEENGNNNSVSINEKSIFYATVSNKNIECINGKVNEGKSNDKDVSSQNGESGDKNVVKSRENGNRENSNRETLIDEKSILDKYESAQTLKFPPSSLRYVLISFIKSMIALTTMKDRYGEDPEKILPIVWDYVMGIEGLIPKESIFIAGQLELFKDSRKDQVKCYPGEKVSSIHERFFEIDVMGEGSCTDWGSSSNLRNGLDQRSIAELGSGSKRGSNIESGSSIEQVNNTGLGSSSKQGRNIESGSSIEQVNNTGWGSGLNQRNVAELGSGSKRGSSKARGLRIWANRGCSYRYPENTLASLEAAANIVGITGVKFDVRCLMDGSFVVIHDETFDRTTNMTGKVCDFSKEILGEIKVTGSGNSRICIGAELPTLEAALKMLKPYCQKINLLLNITVHGKVDINKLFMLIAEQDLTEYVYISSFDEQILSEVRGLRTDIKTMILSDNIYMGIQSMQRGLFDMLGIWNGGLEINAEIADVLLEHELRIPLHVWNEEEPFYGESTPFKEKSLRKYGLLGATDIITNVPERYLSRDMGT